MFDRIAGVYDPLNTAMTAGLHHRWRRRAADLARVGPGSRVLDVASGTGDLAIELAGRVAPGGEVVGSDFSENMLAIAHAKAAKRFGGARYAGGGRHQSSDSGGRQAGYGGSVNLRFEWADALNLPYPDDSFDAATVGFGARNFSDLGLGLAEMARVVRPGGRVVVLEITTPTRPPLSLFYRLWFDRTVPLIGRLAAPLAMLSFKSKDRSSEATIAGAYTYLPNSVRRFPSPDELAAEMCRAGLRDIAYVITAGGIIAIHTATVPVTGQS
jgi:demethylmenaquinone methyltransferase / 2-methoxy-6-polyprenyl-1,4-benzoquinol methylase